MAIEYNGINHFAVSVADLEESIAWYGRIFGFTVRDREEIPGTGVKVAHLQGRGFLLELFCAGAQSRPLPDYRRTPNTDFLTQGNLHFSLGVPDAHKAKDEFAAMGVDIAFVADVNNTYGVFIRDNTGNLIEIFEEG